MNNINGEQNVERESGYNIETRSSGKNVILSMPNGLSLETVIDPNDKMTLSADFETGRGSMKRKDVSFDTIFAERYDSIFGLAFKKNYANDGEVLNIERRADCSGVHFKNKMVDYVDIKKFGPLIAYAENMRSLITSYDEAVKGGNE